MVSLDSSIHLTRVENMQTQHRKGRSSKVRTPNLLAVRLLWVLTTVPLCCECRLRHVTGVIKKKKKILEPERNSLHTCEAHLKDGFPDKMNPCWLMGSTTEGSITEHVLILRDGLRTKASNGPRFIPLASQAASKTWKQRNVSYFNPGKISEGAPGSCFPNWLEGKPRMTNPEYFNSSCSAFSSKGRCGRITITGRGGDSLSIWTNSSQAYGTVSYPCTERCTFSTWRHWRRGRVFLWTRWSPRSGCHLEPALCNRKWYQRWSTHRAGRSDTGWTGHSVFLLHSDCPGVSAGNNKKEFIQLLVTYFHKHTLTAGFIIVMVLL